MLILKKSLIEKLILCISLFFTLNGFSQVSTKSKTIDPIEINKIIQSEWSNVPDTNKVKYFIKLQDNMATIYIGLVDPQKKIIQIEKFIFNGRLPVCEISHYSKELLFKCSSINIPDDVYSRGGIYDSKKFVRFGHEKITMYIKSDYIRFDSLSQQFNKVSNPEQFEKDWHYGDCIKSSNCDNVIEYIIWDKFPQINELTKPLTINNHGLSTQDLNIITSISKTKVLDYFRGAYSKMILSKSFSDKSKFFLFETNIDADNGDGGQSYAFLVLDLAGVPTIARKFYLKDTTCTSKLVKDNVEMNCSGVHGDDEWAYKFVIDPIKKQFLQKDFSSKPVE